MSEDQKNYVVMKTFQLHTEAINQDAKLKEAGPNTKLVVAALLSLVTVLQNKLK